MTAADRYATLARLPLTSTTKATSIRGSISSVRDIVAQRELLGLLVRRDLRSRYKNSALGFLWSLVRPLTQLLIYYIVLGEFLQAARGIPDFAIYIFAGLTAFGLFNEIVSGGTASILNNAGLIKKVQLPREIFPLASVGSALFNFVMQLGILLVATGIASRFPLTLDVLYALPALAIILVYGFAFALLLSALNVYLRDVGYLVEVVLLLLMWSSPIVYAWSFVRNAVGTGWLLEAYTNNPLTLAVLGFHEAFWVAGSEAPGPSDLLLRMAIALGVGLVLLVVAQRIFARLEGNFAQEL